MSEQSAQYIYANKVGNLVAEKNTKIEELTARIADLEAQKEKLDAYLRTILSVPAVVDLERSYPSDSNPYSDARALLAEVTKCPTPTANRNSLTHKPLRLRLSKISPA